MFDLLWAERRKLKRSKILWAAIFGTVMIAAIVFASGLDRYQGPEMQYGVKTLTDGTRYIENAGWFMDEVQPWSVFFVLPAVVALLGSYMICREEEEDTLKCLRMIPVNEAKLTIAKMIIAFAASILLYLLLFAITLLVEMVLHVSDLSSSLIFTCFKEYLLTGIGVFLAVSPIIAFASRVKKYWLALVAAYTGDFHSKRTENTEGADTLRWCAPLLLICRCPVGVISQDFPMKTENRYKS